MKDYHSIPPYKDFLGKQCIAFDKLDGSNLRAEWSAKRGWYKWGTRRRMMDHTDPEYGVAVKLFEQEYGETLIHALDASEFKKYLKNGITVFMEFYGPTSFAGQHTEGEAKTVTVFDVNINKKGFLGPEDFIGVFGNDCRIPKVLYRGEITEDLVDLVRQGKLPVVEGVICKGGDTFDHSLWSCKIKTLAYLQKLKEVFGVGGYQQFWE
jgi:hypothetical protein